MAAKTATVTALIVPDVKREAEAVLERLGFPVSVLIDTLYRQLILTGGVSCPLVVPRMPMRGTMTDEEFDAMLETGYRQALAGEGVPIDEAIATAGNGL